MLDASLRNQAGGRLALDQIDERNTAATLRYEVPADDIVCAIVCALHKYIRCNRLNKMKRRIFIKYHDQID